MPAVSHMRAPSFFSRAAVTGISNNCGVPLDMMATPICCALWPGTFVRYLGRK